jgi:hypothetical protein
VYTQKFSREEPVFARENNLTRERIELYGYHPKKFAFFASQELTKHYYKRFRLFSTTGLSGGLPSV